MYNVTGNSNITGSPYSQSYGNPSFHVSYGGGEGGGPRPPKKNGAGKVAAVLVLLTTLAAGGLRLLDADTSPQVNGGPNHSIPSPTPTTNEPSSSGDSLGGGTGSVTAVPVVELGKTSQNVLDSYYAGWTRTGLNDIRFDMAHFSFPLDWYGDEYQTAEDFAQPKQDYLDRAEAGHWKKHCSFFAADVDTARLAKNSEDVVVDATVTERPAENCDSSTPSVHVEYVLTPSSTASSGYKIKSVRETH